MDIIGIASFVVVFGAVARWFQLAWRVDLPEDPVVFRVLVAIGVILGLTSFASGTGSALAPWAIGLGLFYLYLSFTGPGASAAPPHTSRWAMRSRPSARPTTTTRPSTARASPGLAC